MFLNFIAAYLHAAFRAHKDESPADRAERLTAWATVWMAALTLIIVCVNVGTLAKAAQDQSSWTQRLADNMKTQSDHTKALADEALIQDQGRGTLCDRCQIGPQPR